MAELDEKWEGMEEENKPKSVIEVPHLRGELLALGRLTKCQAPPGRKLR